MNEKAGRPDPDDQGKKRPDAGPAGAKPARTPPHAAEATGSGSGLAGSGGSFDPTIGIEQTESHAQEPSGSTRDAPPPAATLIMAAAKPVAPKEGQVIANRFVVRSMLGQGGMGRVYAVQDRQIEGREVALKVLLPKYSKSAQFRAMFFKEVRAAQEFVSEYICQVRDTGETEDGSLFLTMDLVEGEALRALLDREKVLGPRQALEVTRQVLLGLHSGHEKGYVHRDIKPSNVMLAARIAKTDTNPYGVGVRLLDFGIARLASEIDERSRAGTVMYMSPEQASGEPLDSRSDLFAVGVLLFEMLSGHRPFDGSTTRALVQSVLETNLTARLGEIPNLSKPLRKLLERALQKDRNKRFQSATDFADEIAKSAAYRLPLNVPGWVYAALAIAGVAAVGELIVLQSQSSEIKTLEAEASQSLARMSSAVQQVEQDKERIIEERGNRLAELDSKLMANTVDLEATRKELSTTKAELEGAKSSKLTLEELDKRQREDNQRRESAFQRQLDEVNAKVVNLQKENEKLQAEREQLQLEGSSKGKIAAAFDKIAELVENRLGEGARNYLGQELATFAGDAQLRGFLEALVDATAHVETHLKSVANGAGPRLSEIGEAETLLLTANKGFESLKVGAGGWPDVLLAGQENPRRLERARSMLDGLMEQVMQERLTSVSQDAEAWKAISLANIGTEPQTLFDHFARYGCSAHLSAAADKLLEDLSREAASGSELRVEALRAFKSLDEWVKLLEKKRFVMPPEKAGNLRMFEFAQRWYDPDSKNVDFDWRGISLPPIRESSSSWKHVLQLQHELAQESSGYPIRSKDLILSRQVEANGVTTWVEDEDVSNPYDHKTWNIRRRFADADGQFRPRASPVSFERVDDQIRLQPAGVVYLDLKAHGARVHVEPLPKLALDPIPYQLLQPQKVEAFRKLYASAEGTACLVVSDSDVTRWFSPKFGMVREKYVVGWTQDLVYLRGAL